jgi:hypothetical protein
VFTVRYEVMFRRLLQQKLSSDIYQQPVRAEAIFLHAVTKLRKTTISFVMSVCLPLSVFPHGTIQLPLDGYSRNIMFEYFSKICREIYGLWFRASSNIQIKQPTGCTLSCKIYYFLVV